MPSADACVEGRVPAYYLRLLLLRGERESDAALRRDVTGT